jgi:hypothetical protein
MRLGLVQAMLGWLRSLKFSQLGSTVSSTVLPDYPYAAIAMITRTRLCTPQIRSLVLLDGEARGPR